MHRTAPSPPGPHPVCKKGGGAGEEEQDSQGLSADVCPPYVHKSSNASQASTTTVQSDFARTPNESNKGLVAITFYLIVSGLRKVFLRKFHMISLLCFQKGIHVELNKYFQRPFKASDLKCFVKMSKSGFVHSNILCSFSIAANIGFVWSYIIMIWHDLKWMWICNLVLRQYTNAVQTNKHTNKQNANAVSQCLKPFFIFRWVSTALLYTLGTVRVLKKQTLIYFIFRL